MVREVQHGRETKDAGPRQPDRQDVRVGPGRGGPGGRAVHGAESPEVHHADPADVAEQERQRSHLRVRRRHHLEVGQELVSAGFTITICLRL